MKSEKSKVESVTQSYGIETLSEEESQTKTKDFSESIADKGLKKFYEHLDKINKQEVSAFQMYNRYRQQLVNIGKSNADSSFPASLPLEFKLLTNNQIADVTFLIKLTPCVAKFRYVPRGDPERSEKVCRRRGTYLKFGR